MFEAIIAAAERLRSEPGVRAVVLHGEGPSFCSGLDFAGADGRRPDGLEADRRPPARGAVPNWFQRAAYDWIALPVPVIAAMHGNCLGGGLQIALAADIRIAAPDARLSVMEVRWGLIPDMAITRTLPRLVGIDVAKELTYTGRAFTRLRGPPAGHRHPRVRATRSPRPASSRPRSPLARRTPSAGRSACSTRAGPAAPRRRWRSRPSSSAG